MPLEKICVVGDETRKQIHSDPETFCESMKQLDIIPDIWRLHDWSTWLTPIGLKVSLNMCVSFTHGLCFNAMANKWKSSATQVVSLNANIP